LALCGAYFAFTTICNAQTASLGSDDRPCATTKTVQVDAPAFDWREAETGERARYGALAGRTVLAREIADMFPRPLSVDQLLRNLKLAVDADLAVQPHFFDEPVILKFLGASSVKWRNQQVGPDNKVRIGTIGYADTPLSGFAASVRRLRLLQERNAHCQLGDQPDHLQSSTGFARAQIAGLDYSYRARAQAVSVR
jgi:hypothetical protein